MLIGHRHVSFCFALLNLLITVLLTMPAISLAAQTPRNRGRTAVD